MTLLSLVLVLAVILTVLWNVVLVHDYRRLRDLAAADGTFHWTLIALGTALFLATIVLSCILGIQLIANLRWTKRQSDFVASVTHELNSPLGSIKLFAQTLRQEGLSRAERENFAGKIVFDVDRLSRIIANLLRAAEIDNRGVELAVDRHDLDLRAYLEDYIEDARALNAGKLEISLDAAEEVRAPVDAMMFRQVLDNLVDNAVRYRGAGLARVTCRLVRTDGWARLEVADEGIGMPRDQLGEIFERFRRVEGRVPAGGRRGMGIGLYVVRSIVRGHGGRVEAASEGPGHGTAITIHLPTSPPAAVPV